MYIAINPFQWLGRLVLMGLTPVGASTAAQVAPPAEGPGLSWGARGTASPARPGRGLSCWALHWGVLASNVLGSLGATL